MRLPGTHNTKQGAFTPVEVISQSAARYELDDLEEWLSETSPIILRKVRPAATPTDNPFLIAAQRLGFKPSIDVEKRLAGMTYMGGGDSAIHATQLAVSASLLNTGMPLSEVVDTLVTATRAAAGEYGVRWNWKREERAIQRMCEEWLRKHPQQPKSLSAAATRQADTTLQAAREREIAVNGAGGQAGAAVVNLAAKRQEKSGRKASASDRQTVANVVADGVIEAVRSAGHDMLLTEGEVWIYAGGIWRVMTPADQQWLLTLIQEGFEAIGEPNKPSNLNAAWKRLTEHPSLFKRTVVWAGSDVIVCQNGVLEVGSRQFHPHGPHWLARRKIGVEYQPGTTAPKFANLLQSMFSDRGDAAAYGSIVQQWAGAALAVSHLSREERKALLLVGPSRTGKTELSRVMRGLIGDPVATPSVAEISERFGLSSLFQAAAWIRDDAINEGDNLDPQRFKTIVTGEPIDIERKHKPVIAGVELALPVLLTTNALPRARDKSDAIFNRAIVLEMTNVVSEEAAPTARARIGVPRGTMLGSWLVAQEGSGILNWALDGLAKLLERGSYDLPESVRNANQRFKDDNNPVGEWARTAIVKVAHGKVSRADLACAYHGWQREQDGDDARALGNRALIPRLRAAAPWIGETTDDHGRRYLTGIHLTGEGLQYWDLHMQGPQLKGGSKGSSLTKHDVNKLNQKTEENPNAPRF
jgi:P4 family phage/plasmid primase-like protien